MPKGDGFKQVFHSLSFRGPIKSDRGNLILIRLPRPLHRTVQGPRNDDCGIRGFTLIELLVTLSIIAILATIGIVSYQVVLKNSRDAKRQADFKVIQSALEQYHADQLFYPSALSFGNSITNCTGNVLPCTVSKTYLNTAPTDPIANPQYNYVAKPDSPVCDNSATKCLSYCLYAKLENATIMSGSCFDISPYTLEVTPP